MQEHETIMSLGSNTESETCFGRAKELIEKEFDGVVFSRSVWTSPIGIESGNFMNAVAIAKTHRDEAEITECLKNIERECGDSREKRGQNIVRMDIDLLSFDGHKRHENDWSRPYIVELLHEIRKDKQTHTL